MGTLQPLAGASRTLSQLSEDGLLPRSWANRTRRDVPWVPTLLTAGLAIGALVLGRPDVDDRGRELHLPDRHQPALGRGHAAAPQRARARAALPRAARDDRARRRSRLSSGSSPPAWASSSSACRPCCCRSGWPTPARCSTPGGASRTAAARACRASSSSLSLKLTGAMVAVMALDGAGYLLAVSSVDAGQPALDLAAPGHLRGGGHPHDHRRPRPPRHHRARGRADLGRRRAAGHRHASPT